MTQYGSKLELLSPTMSITFHNTNKEKLFQLQITDHQLPDGSYLKSPKPTMTTKSGLSSQTAVVKPMKGNSTKIFLMPPLPHAKLDQPVPNPGHPMLQQLLHEREMTNKKEQHF
jgi:hypothetical protein